MLLKFFIKILHSCYRVHILEAISMVDRQANFLVFQDPLSTCNLLNEKYHAVHILTVFWDHFTSNKYLKTEAVSS